ncbi:hypothetical protein QBC38DRAFT_442627 [Podospora fimiseda]|uniref:DUF7730 domain-containing protein n=1 Tax=Podospora fimiseda TaxID=252190 RepID=A0AAN7BSE2_9PEZI|nr:hypothetical protein QBC38DRAFT_442627 [Podospora fimiseda]
MSSFSQRGLLLGLPPELRIMIYSYLLTFRRGVCIREWPGSPKLLPQRHLKKKKVLRKSAVRLRCWLPILRVNKQIYDETTEFLYSRHTFHFCRAESVLWLDHFNKRSSDMIREMTCFIQKSMWNDICGDTCVQGAQRPLLQSRMKSLRRLTYYFRPLDHWEYPEEMEFRSIRFDTFLTGLIQRSRADHNSPKSKWNFKAAFDQLREIRIVYFPCKFQDQTLAEALTNVSIVASHVRFCKNTEINIIVCVANEQFPWSKTGSPEISLLQILWEEVRHLKDDEAARVLNARMKSNARTATQNSIRMAIDLLSEHISGMSFPINDSATAYWLEKALPMRPTAVS